MNSRYFLQYESLLYAKYLDFIFSLFQVFDVQEGLTYCLEHAVAVLETNKIQSAKCKLIVTYDDEDLLAVPAKMTALIDSKLQKKNPK